MWAELRKQTWHGSSKNPGSSKSEDLLPSLHLMGQGVGLLTGDLRERS